MKKQLSFASLLLFYTTMLCAQITYYPSQQKNLIKDWGYDIKQQGKATGLTEEFARTLYEEDGMTILRIPIWAKSGHNQDRTVNANVYKEHNQAIRNVLKVKPDAIIFTSLKLDGENSFPDWAFDASTGCKAYEYAQILADYLKYMKSEGLPLHVLGIDNEMEYNKGKITPQKHIQILDYLKQFAQTEGFEIPSRLVGPEPFGPNADWVETLLNLGGGDKLDIVGTHYYPKFRPRTKLLNMINAGAGREAWNTEVHWDKIETDGATLIDEAEETLVATFDNTDFGMNGYVWWAYVRTGIKGGIQRELVRSTVGAHVIDVVDSDGGAANKGKLVTRAFRKGNEVAIWIVNNRDVEVADCPLLLGNDGQLLGNASYFQWTSTEERTGTLDREADGDSYKYTVPARTVSLIRIPVQMSDSPLMPNLITLSENSVAFGTLSANRKFYKTLYVSVEAPTTDVALSLDGSDAFHIEGESIIPQERLIWQHPVVVSFTPSLLTSATTMLTVTSGGDSRQVAFSANVGKSFAEYFNKSTMSGELSVESLNEQLAWNSDWEGENLSQGGTGRINIMQGVAQNGFLLSPEIDFSEPMKLTFKARMIKNGTDAVFNKGRNFYAIIGNDTIYDHKKSGSTLYQNFNTWTATYWGTSADHVRFAGFSSNEGGETDGVVVGEVVVEEAAIPTLNLGYANSVYVGEVPPSTDVTYNYTFKGHLLSSPLTLTPSASTTLSTTQLVPSEGELSESISILFRSEMMAGEYTRWITVGGGGFSKPKTLWIHYSVSPSNSIASIAYHTKLHIEGGTLFVSAPTTIETLVVVDLMGRPFARLKSVRDVTIPLVKGQTYVVLIDGIARKILVR